MRYHLQDTPSYGVCFMTALLLNGCSMLSTGVVVITNEAAQHGATMAPEEASHIKPGTPVRVAFRDGSSVQGEFVAVEQMSGAGQVQLKLGEEVVAFGLEEVAGACIEPKRYAVLPAFLTGLAIDTVVVLVWLVGGPGSLPSSMGISW